jgi:hypothetical protein
MVWSQPDCGVSEYHFKQRLMPCLSFGVKWSTCLIRIINTYLIVFIVCLFFLIPYLNRKAELGPRGARGPNGPPGEMVSCTSCHDLL